MASARDISPAVNRSRKLNRTARRPASRPPATRRIPTRTTSSLAPSRSQQVRGHAGVLPLLRLGRLLRRGPRQKPGGAHAEDQVHQESPRRHRTLPPPAHRAGGAGRPEHGLNQLGERIRGESGDQKHQRDTPPRWGDDFLHGSGAARRRAQPPVRFQRQAQSEVADKEVHHAAASQTKSRPRAQPNPPRALRQRGRHRIQERSGRPAVPLRLIHRTVRLR